MDIVSRSQWGARPPRGSIATTTWSRRVGIAIHHTGAGLESTPKPSQNWHMDNNGWVDIGYNLTVNQQGRVFEGRAGGILAVGAHARGQNTGWIGVQYSGHSDRHPPTPAALRSLRAVVDWLRAQKRARDGGTLQVRGHGQVPGQNTTCPGNRLRLWIAAGMPVDGAEEDDDMPTAKEVADEVIARLTVREVSEDSTLAKAGLFAAGRTLAPRSGLAYGWGYAKVARRSADQALAELAGVRAELAAQRELITGLAGGALTDEQVHTLADRIAAAGQGACNEVLARLTAAGQALADDDGEA